MQTDGWAGFESRARAFALGFAVACHASSGGAALAQSTPFTTTQVTPAQATTPQSSTSQGAGPTARPTGWSAKVSGPNKGRGEVAAATALGAAAAPAAVATALILTGDSRRTHIVLEVSQPIVANVFTLADPYRAVIDVAGLEFRLTGGPGSKVSGVVKSYRYGQFDAGRSRVVFDLGAPARIEQAKFTPPSSGQTGRLTFDLVEIAAAEFTGVSGAPPPAAPPQSGPAGTSASATGSGQLRPSRVDETVAPGGGANALRQSGQARRIIVIDPGHGGVDPGTVAATSLTEKVVVLAVAMELKTQLQQPPRRYDVRMTRQADTFVSLDQRLEFSQHSGAELFISIHADALAEVELAQTVNGASIYTLADRASNDAARRLADKENAADLLAGLSSVPASAEDQVRHILLDLVQRETANFSAEFRTLLLGAMRAKVPMARDPARSAAFKVLKQAETPAVLIELGYMSNTADLARLSRADWQRQVAGAIAGAVDAFFTKHAPAKPR